MIDFSKIDDGEINRTLIQAHDEILRLRARLTSAEPKAEAYDTIALIARMPQHNKTSGFSPDIAWQIKQLLEEAKAPTPKVSEEDGNVR